VYYDETAFSYSQPAEIEGVTSSLDFFQAAAANDPASARLLAEYDKEYPGSPYKFSAGSGATGAYRAVMLWATAVKEANSVDRAPVAAALDVAKISEGPGGPAQMVPGKRHAKMNMYIAQAKGGKFEIVNKSDGLVDPKEC